MLIDASTILFLVWPFWWYDVHCSFQNKSFTCTSPSFVVLSIGTVFPHKMDSALSTSFAAINLISSNEYLYSLPVKRNKIVISKALCGLLFVVGMLVIFGISNYFTIC